MSKENTIEIVENEVKKEEVKLPTKDELKEKGWSSRELESAEKRGMVQKEEKKDGDSEVEDAQKKPEEKINQNKEKDEKKEEVVENRNKSHLPDFTFKTPEQEKAFLDAFGAGTPQRAMYFRMKAERQDRQRAQEERDKALLKAQMLEDQIENFKKNATSEVDENGEKINPEDQPLTPRMLREIREKEEAERIAKERELQGQASKVSEALLNQEEFARSVNPDYDQTVELAKEVITKLDELVPDIKSQKKILKLWQDLQVTSASADKLSVEDYNAADISYEIGKFHPNYGKSSNGTHTDDGKLKDPNKANGSLTPEQMKRIEANTQRRASSASIPGGNGKRTVSIEDITVKDVLKMTPEQRQKFRKEHPEKMAELLRG